MAKRKAPPPRAAQPEGGSRIEQVWARAAVEARPFIAELVRQHGTATQADLEDGDALVPDPEAVRKFEDHKARITRRLWAEMFPREVRRAVITEITQDEEAAMPKTVRKAKAKSEGSKKSNIEKVVFEAPVRAEQGKDGGPQGPKKTLKMEFRKGSVLMGIAELFTREPGLTKKEIIAKAQAKFPDHDPKSIDMHVVWAITHLPQKYPGFWIGRDDEGRYSTLIVGRSTKRPPREGMSATLRKAKKAAPKKAKAKKSAKADKPAAKKAKAPKAKKSAAPQPLVESPDVAPAAEAAPAPTAA
jgi:hypothetical protein